MAESLDPIAALIREFDEDTQLRLDSIENLSTIALPLDEERIRTVLIPFLTKAASVQNKKDVLFALAKQLGTFMHFEGGPAYAMSLISSLKILAADEAAESLELIAAQHTECYKRVPSAIQAKLRDNFRQLCQDETAVVRCAAASKLDEFAKVVEVQCVKSDLIPMFEELALDRDDLVRLYAIEACVGISQSLQQEEDKKLLMPTLNLCVNDSWWRVRQLIANMICDLQTAVGPNITSSDLVPAFESLLIDEEDEVSSTAKEKLREFWPKLNKNDRQSVNQAKAMHLLISALKVAIPRPNSDAEHLSLQDVAGGNSFLQRLKGRG